MTDLRGWRFCPRCGTAVEPDGHVARCAACGYEAYANPAPALCALVLDDRGRILLGRRAHDPDAGKWDVLGGFAEEDEDGEEILRREMREEIGCEIEILDYVGCWADRYGPDGNATLNFYWTARVAEGTPRAADDVAALEWFPLDRLPGPDELAFAVNGVVLDALRRRLGAPGRPRGMFEVQLVALDLDALVAFYRDELRLPVTVDDRGRGRVHFGLGRGQLICVLAHGEEASPGWPGLPPPLLVSSDPRGPTPEPHGPVHFALEVEPDRLLAEGERLRAAGHDVRGPFRWPDGWFSTYLRDPEGNVVELIGHG